MESNTNSVNKVTEEQIQSILDQCEINTATAFDKCTIVACKLPNGFVIVESSGAVDKDNYNFDLGVEICKRRIVDQIWKMEGYLLASIVNAGKIALRAEGVESVEEEKEPISAD